jgi:DNA-binding response OmpR family regulator
MPGMDGLEVCQAIRKTSRVGIIMLTAKGNQEDKITCLNAGADDYLTKPFDVNELEARIRAVLRRTSSVDTQSQPSICKCQDLTVYFDRSCATLNDEMLDLTAMEYKLLGFLARNADRILSAHDILMEVWGREYERDVNILEININRLRGKLKDPAEKNIETVYGRGYMLKSDGNQAKAS